MSESLNIRILECQNLLTEPLINSVVVVVIVVIVVIVVVVVDSYFKDNLTT